MAKQKWTKDNIPNQSGRVAIVTGSSSGIGWAAARALAEKGAKVIIAVRNRDKGAKAQEKIQAAVPNAQTEVMIVDLADLGSVKKFAAEFNKKYKELDLLINNAGVMMPPKSETKDGFELQFGTNHLGHFALTALLIEPLKKAKDSRVVNVSSMAHKWGDLNLDDPNWENRRYSKMKSYGDSKISNLHFTFELARRLKSEGASIMVTAAHPGWTATELQRHQGLFEMLNPFFAQTIEMGALPTLRAAVDPEAQSGDYFGPSGFMEMRGYPVKVGTNKAAKDQGTASRLWELSEKLTGVGFKIAAPA